MKIVMAPAGLVDVLARELGERAWRNVGDLFWVDDDQPISWAQNIWFDAEEIKVDSISKAAAHLRSIQRNWALHSVAHHRRAQLIQDGLPKIKSRTVDYFEPTPKAPLGAWTLLEPNLMAFASRTLSRYADGQMEFNEDKEGPPSRAYLKLWEFFTRHQMRPRSGEKVLDLGSSPGGWTWVLDQTGCETISVDKAPFAESFHPSKRVTYRGQSAFALFPEEIGPVDWMFSDIVCYPDRLLELIHRWEPFARNMVCTIKFQGETDFAAIERFRAIPGSVIEHLSVNKHELTWSRLAPQRE